MATKPTKKEPPKPMTLSEAWDVWMEQNRYTVLAVGIVFILIFGTMLVLNIAMMGSSDKTADQIAKEADTARRDAEAAQIEAERTVEISSNATCPEGMSISASTPTGYTCSTATTTSPFGSFFDIFNFGEGQSIFGRLALITMILFGFTIISGGRRRMFGVRMNGIAGFIFCQAIAFFSVYIFGEMLGFSWIIQMVTAVLLYVFTTSFLRGWDL